MNPEPGTRNPGTSHLVYPPDVRFALRRWRRRPGFALTAILTLALGIGATTSIFSVVDAVILRPLPWPEADRLVVVHGVYPDRRQDPAYATTWNRGTLTCPMWDALEQVSAFEDVAVWRWTGAVDITFGEGRTEIVSTGEMSSALLPLLRGRVLHGRNLTVEDDLKPTYAMLLPYETWQRRFGGRPDVLGQAVTMGHASSGGSHKRTIVGVVEPGFEFDSPAPEFLWNAGTAGEVCRTYDTGGYRGIARLAPGATLESASVEAATVIAGLDRREPTTVRLVPLVEEELGDAAQPLWLVFGAAGILLLVACSNVAGLLLGDGRARRHEIGVRVALGGSRFRIVRQLVVEHGLMALLGSAGGLVLAIWITQFLVGLAPPELPRLDTVSVDARAAVFALSLGLATFLFFGVAPALTLARTPALRVIAEGSRDAAGGRHLGQRLIVGVEMALALVLLVGAALFGETIFRMISQPLGFNPENVAVVSTTFTGSRFPDLAAFRAARGRMGSDPYAMSRLMSSVAAARTTRVTERLRAVPGVARAAGAASLPFVLRPYSAEIVVDGRPGRQRARSAVVSEEYFDALQIPVVRGRGFDGTDRNGGATVAVVSQEFEERYLDGDAVGRRFVRAGGLEVTYQVVGVVPNVKFRQYTDEDEPVFYALDRQVGESRHFVIRTEVDPTSVLPAIRQALADVDPQIVVTRTTTMAELTRVTVAQERFRAMLSAAFGAAALVLAAVGLYGLGARRVADRRREFGVRTALGASPANLHRLVLRDGMAIVLIGLLAGLPAAFAASQVTQSFLFGVTPASPHVFLIPAAVLALAAVFAMIGPARRAGKLDPVAVLRD